jgi:tRNA G18 (ribose-2'-O)-methylase SpoU
MEPETVSDRDDPRLADYVDLRAGATPDSIVIAEGLLAVEQLASSSYPVRSVLVTPKRVDRLPAIDAPVYVASEELLRATVGFNLHRGVVAAADRLPPTPAADLLAGASRVAVLESINDHENLGALFRNARAFGIDAVLLDPTTADPLYRRAVRVSLGHVLHVPFARLPSLDTLDGFTVIALTPGGDTDISALPPLDRVAFLLGAEGPGLSPAALSFADHRVRIPVARDVDSLNVATAAAIAFDRLRDAR